jgi:ribonuclease E
MPAGIGMIIRTAGLDRSLSELSRDVSLQLKVWEGIVRDAQAAPSPTCLYEESDLAKRVIRDYFTPEVREILIDDPHTYEQVKQFVGEVMPRYRSRVKRYEEERPLFSAFNIEEQVLSTMRREVKLPSGGALVVDSLEALVAIDVNSGKSTGGDNIEDTAYRTNLEAADEIARQLRLRDLGGLIVVDFIDMMDRRHKAAIERKMREAVKGDKARIEVGRLSRFGLLEMSRQRLRASLSSQSHLKCSHCQGVGHVRNPELVALEVLRKIQTAVSAGHLSTVKARVSPPAAMFLLNNKKSELVHMEQSHHLRIVVLADGRLSIDEYDLEIESAKQTPGAVRPSATPMPPVPPPSGGDEPPALEAAQEIGNEIPG